MECSSTLVVLSLDKALGWICNKRDELAKTVRFMFAPLRELYRLSHYSDSDKIIDPEITGHMMWLSRAPCGENRWFER